MNPLLLLAIVLGGGYVAYQVWNDQASQRDRQTSDRLSAERHAAITLDQGKTYGVVTRVNPQDPTWQKGDTLEAASNQLRAALQALGWKVLSAPALREANGANAFLMGTSAEWVLTATWARSSSPPPASGPGWLSGTRAYLLPVRPS